MPLYRLLLLLLLICVTNGCASSNRQDASTANGALIGAAAGAVIGEHNDNPLGGALLGATTGAIAGNMIGESQGTAPSAYEQKFQADQELLRRQSQQQASDAVTIEQLLKMTRAGVNDDIVVAQIQARGAAQHLSTDDIIALTHENVSPTVIKGYQNGLATTKTANPNSTRIERSPEGPVVVERHYHHGYSPRHYPPTPVPPRSGIFFGVGN